MSPDGAWFFSLCLVIRLAAGIGSGVLTTTSTSIMLKTTSFSPSTIMVGVRKYSKVYSNDIYSNAKGFVVIMTGLGVHSYRKYIILLKTTLGGSMIIITLWFHYIVKAFNNNHFLIIVIFFHMLYHGKRTLHETSNRSCIKISLYKLSAYILACFIVT